MNWPFSVKPQAFVTGVVRLDDGMLKVYVGQRGNGIYTLVDDEAAAREIERAWGNPMQHVLIPCPPNECLYSDDPLPKDAPK